MRAGCRYVMNAPPTFDIMRNLLENGPVLKPGQTIAMAAEQIRIPRSPSLFGHPGKVIRLVP